MSWNMGQLTLQKAFDLALQRQQAGHLAEAGAIYRQILSRNPDHHDALHMLGVLSKQMGDDDAAIDLIGRAIRIQPDCAEAHNNLGSILNDKGRFGDAAASCRRAIQLKPSYAQAHYNLGNAQAAMGQFDEAISSYQSAIQFQADFAEAFNNLGGIYLKKGRFGEAIQTYRRAIELHPTYSDAFNNLGSALSDSGRIDEAIVCYRRAIQLNPDGGAVHNNLANALVSKGQVEQAIALYRRAVELSPNDSAADSNLVYTLYFHRRTTQSELLAENLRWARLHADSLKPFVQSHDNDRDPNRRIRLGYVSPDFHGAHCQSLFTVPLFSSHNRDEFEVFCYADVTNSDDVTQILHGSVDGWRITLGLSDAKVAEMVRSDRIDILVDLTMHMAHGRPLLFARKPAPVQVAWLAYPGTTGLDAIDYRLTDPYLDPPGVGDEFYVERSIRLPETFWCYDAMSAEAVAGLPAAQNGYATFGCLNNFCKINNDVLALWSRVLASSPGAHLLLLSPAGDHRQWVLERLGVEPFRVEFIEHQPRAHYLGEYLRIDIMLDTVPYNGHTTSLDSLWMGVPVVSLVGNTVVGRAGLSILTNIGLPELVARDEDQFVRCAVELAGDLARLAELRRTIRPLMLKSPLMDAKRFSRNIENVYRQMWRAWCSGRALSAGA